jgi:hypothetical protein
MYSKLSAAVTMRISAFTCAQAAGERIRQDGHEQVRLVEVGDFFVEVGEGGFEGLAVLGMGCGS